MTNLPEDSAPFGGSDFLSLIAHELSQPLTAARGSVGILLGEQLGALPQDSRDRLMSIVVRNLDQMASLIDSLRVFSDAVAGELELNYSPVMVEVLIREAHEDFADAVTHRVIETSCPQDLAINVDITLFRQVLSNVIANAVKFSPAGSGIRITARGERNEVVISITNEGRGFPAAESERIFERSVRLDPGARGFGLGLYVARAIMDAHGGRISGIGDPTKGTTFEIAVPRHPANLG